MKVVGRSGPLEVDEEMEGGLGGVEISGSGC